MWLRERFAPREDHVMAELESGDRLSTAVGASGRRACRDLRVLWGVAVVTLLGVLLSLQLDERSSIDHAAVAAGAAELEERSTYDARAGVLSRSEERRGGKGGGSTCKSWWTAEQ